MNDVDIVNCSDLNDKQHEVHLTQSEPVGGGVEHLRHGDAEQVIQVTRDGAPAAVLVTAEAVEEHIPGIRTVMTNIIMSGPCF